MTTSLETEAESWTAPPGWGIYADLTPPELHDARRLKRLRRLLLGLLAVAVVLVVLAYGVARYQSHEAAAEVAAEQATAARLQAQQLHYAPVTAIEGSVASVRAQLADLLVSDVAFAKILDSVAAVTPRGVKITAEQVTIVDAAGAAATTTDTGSGTSLVTTGIPLIGQIVLSGTVPDLRTFAGYLVALQTIRGVAEVVPGSTQVDPGAITFGVTLSVTNAFLSHHWDIAPSATPAAGSAATAGSTARATATSTPAARASGR